MSRAKRSTQLFDFHTFFFSPRIINKTLTQMSSKSSKILNDLILIRRMERACS